MGTSFAVDDQKVTETSNKDKQQKHRYFYASHCISCLWKLHILKTKTEDRNSEPKLTLKLDAVYSSTFELERFVQR